MTEMTRAKRAVYDAQAKEEAWGYAESILRPWVEATRPIGSDELTAAMQEALAFALREYGRAVDELGAAKQAL
jgi:hypothetical protein